MSGSFQTSAFQSDAFQVVATPLEIQGSAFQANAFQGGAFQISGARVAPATTQAYSGGWRFPEHKRKTAEDIQEERIRLGIIPKPVQKAVAKAAKRVIEQAKQQDASSTRPDPLVWLAQHHEQERALLARTLRQRQIQADQDAQRTYMILLRIEIEAQIERQRLQDEEDEQIVTLLFSM